MNSLIRTILILGFTLNMAVSAFASDEVCKSQVGDGFTEELTFTTSSGDHYSVCTKNQGDYVPPELIAVKESQGKFQIFELIARSMFESVSNDAPAVLMGFPKNQKELRQRDLLVIEIQDSKPKDANTVELTLLLSTAQGDEVLHVLSKK